MLLNIMKGREEDASSFELFVDKNNMKENGSERCVKGLVDSYRLSSEKFLSKREENYSATTK